MPQLHLAVNVPATAFFDLEIARMVREEGPTSADWPGLILEVTEDKIVNGKGAGTPLGILNSPALITNAIEGTQTIANSAQFLGLNCDNRSPYCVMAFQELRRMVPRRGDLAVNLLIKQPGRGPGRPILKGQSGKPSSLTNGERTRGRAMSRAGSPS